MNEREEKEEEKEEWIERERKREREGRKNQQRNDNNVRATKKDKPSRVPEGAVRRFYISSPFPVTIA